MRVGVLLDDRVGGFGPSHRGNSGVVGSVQLPAICSGGHADSSHFTKNQMIETKSMKNISREHWFITFAIGDENGACDGKVPRFASR